MSEEEMQSVEETQDVAQSTESTEHNDVSKEEQLAEQKRRNDAEYNWAEVRRQMREKDQQIEELSKKFQQMQKPQEEEDDLGSLAEDDILTVAQARKLAAKMAKNAAQDVIKQRDDATAEERVQLKYPDYADVVSKENIEYLKQTEPELVESLLHMPDKYKQAVAAYKLLKKVSVKNEGPSIEKKKAMENVQKPQSVNAVTKQSAIGNAHLFENGLTKELKTQLWKEMQESMKIG